MLLAGLLAFGVAGGLLAVSINAQAVLVERAYRRPLMASFHASYSLGGLTGAVTGGILAWVQAGPVATCLVAALPPAIVAGAAGHWLLAEPVRVRRELLAEPVRVRRELLAEPVRVRRELLAEPVRVRRELLAEPVRVRRDLLAEPVRVRRGGWHLRRIAIRQWAAGSIGKASRGTPGQVRARRGCWHSVCWRSAP